MTISNIILIIVSTIFLTYIIFSIYFYRKKIFQYNNIVLELKEIVDTVPNMRIDERINATKELFNLIDLLIDYEIINNRRFEIYLDKKDTNLNVDQMLKDVSSAVFKFIKTDIFVDKNNIVTYECLFNYIQKRTFVEYFNYIQQRETGAD